MALVHHQPDRAHDWSLIGLVVAIFGIIALSTSCLKVVVDQCFSLIW